MHRTSVLQNDISLLASEHVLKNDLMLRDIQRQTRDNKMNELQLNLMET